MFRERKPSRKYVVNSVLDKFSTGFSYFWNFRRPMSVILGPFCGLLVTFLGDKVTRKEFRMAGILVWMAVWWLTEVNATRRKERHKSEDQF